MVVDGGIDEQLGPRFVHVLDRFVIGDQASSANRSIAAIADAEALIVSQRCSSSAFDSTRHELMNPLPIGW